MQFEPTHVKNIRKQLNLTQHQLAQRAGISQSMIAKIEAGKLNPPYSKVKKIEAAFAILTSSQEKQAKYVMKKQVSSVTPSTAISQVIHKMARTGYSQLPVIDNGVIVGLITESTLAQRHDVHAKVVDVMDEVPPPVQKNTGIQVIKYHQIRCD